MVLAGDLHDVGLVQKTLLPPYQWPLLF
jgi:hypothetical protein